MLIFKILLHFVLTLTSKSVACGLGCRYFSHGDKISFQNGQTSVNSRGEQYPQIRCKNCYLSAGPLQIDCIHNGYDQLNGKVDWKCYTSEACELTHFSISCEGFRQNDYNEFYYENSCSIAVSVTGVERFLGGIDELVLTGSASIGGFFTGIGKSINSFFASFPLTVKLIFGIVLLFIIGRIIFSVNNYSSSGLAYHRVSADIDSFRTNSRACPANAESRPSTAGSSQQPARLSYSSVTSALPRPSSQNARESNRTNTIGSVQATSRAALPRPSSQNARVSNRTNTIGSVQATSRVIPPHVLATLAGRPLPPTGLENAGYWEDRDKFRGKKSFCYFKCVCGKWWTSAHGFKDARQACKSCNKWSFPVFMWKNFERSPVKTMDPVDRGPHDQARCEMCRRLGRGCWSVNTFDEISM